MLTIATVLRSGGEYKPEHVRHLRDGIVKHLTLEHRLVCLTDVPQPDYKCILLRHDWPGWFAKLEIFRPGLFDGPVIYLDLDTVIVGPLDDIVLGHRFTVLQNFWVPDGHPRIGSGLMAWDPQFVDLKSLYLNFAEAPERYMAEFSRRDPDRHGDQGFIQANWPFPMDRWQSRHPGRVQSWKNDCVPAGKIPPSTSVIVFHGKPRPWEVDWSAHR